ncbi:ricin-type beta-trefoil lectin domain protein [Kribbella sandramycini]|uniref:Ricin-type beta-trefoil lectin domain protein n=1 Tax=Kribbella sandramycini TaxID=60450 RepID=A0A7Y4KUK9_9ACTN|nr:RICIN domain-containing protein [Kribbella sandramycini]MBB6568504.1 hypothetical protein [Kribbella sandramycini]NOL38908.1 ricin-type beta-trefoil lectin domain protein [Kribbella sandramycini]
MAGSLLAVVPPAYAGPTAVVNVKNAATGRCLQAFDDARVVRTNGCAGLRSQEWEWQRSARPEFGMLRNNSTGRCLDANGSGGVYTNVCDVNNTFQWFVRQPDTTIKHGASGRYLDSNGGGDVYTLPANGSPNQRWNH